MKRKIMKKIEVVFELSSAVCSNVILKIPELNINKIIDVKDGKGYEIIECEHELWSSENPKLYDVEVTYSDDSIKEEIGF
jgi:beta-glucuronidase